MEIRNWLGVLTAGMTRFTCSGPGSWHSTGDLSRQANPHERVIETGPFDDPRVTLLFVDSSGPRQFLEPVLPARE